MAELQDLINKLPWRKKDREKREKRAAYRVANIEQKTKLVLTDVLGERAAFNTRLRTLGLVLAGSFGVVWLAKRWGKRRKRRKKR